MGRVSILEGLRQGCPLSPLLFAIYISDVEDYLKGKQVGGVVVGKHKLHSLTYADGFIPRK